MIANGLICRMDVYSGAGYCLGQTEQDSRGYAAPLNISA